MTMTESEQTAFRKKLTDLCNRLMMATGLKNKSQLGRWLYKSNDRKAEMYFSYASHECYLNYALLIERCIEDNLDLNEIFGSGKRTEEYEELFSKYRSIEKQVTKLIEQNGHLLKENKTIGEEFRKISNSSQELMLKYMEMINKGR
jgi:hypothetical protein